MTSLHMIGTLATAAFASALVAGIFLAFSDFTMRSMQRATGNSGVEVMQVLNREVFRSIFMVLLIGMAPVALIIGGLAIWSPPEAGTALIIAGTLAYVIGVFLVTIFGNVPLNRTLAAMPDGSAEAQAYWPRYYSGWIMWNHVRTGFSMVTAIC